MKHRTCHGSSPQTILARYRQGEVIPAQARALGVRHQSLYAFLRHHCPGEWQAAQLHRAEGEYRHACYALTRARKAVFGASYRLTRLRNRLADPAAEIAKRRAGLARASCKAF